jgi:SAM-dependent methyltransferase
MSLKAVAKALTPPIVWSIAKCVRGVFQHRGDKAVQAPPTPRDDFIALGHVETLLARFPELQKFGLKATASNAGPLIDFYADVLPLSYEPARAAHIRNALSRLRSRCSDATLSPAIEKAIAITELEANNCPDRSTILRHDTEYGPAWAAECAAMEAAYGAPLVSQTWPSAERGAALIHFFRQHTALLKGKKVFHLAPEADLRDWISQNGQVASYSASDAYGDNADENQDITAINHADESFDVILCHRIMEHVLDDQKGFSELYRILRPGGFVSFSVPQAPHRPQTSEWVIPDLTHHSHLRHYGADLEDRMRAAGFVVEIEPWLLTRPRHELLAAKAFPMRIFHLRKGPRS